MSLKTITRKLKTFKTQYDKRYTYNEQTKEYELTHENLPLSVTARYNSLNNQITCFENNNSESQLEEKKEEPFGFKEVEKSTYYHEFNHLLTRYGIDSIFTQLSEEVIAMENEKSMRNQQ